MNRLERIKNLRWELGTSVLPNEIKENLSTLETQFFSVYDKNLGEYMRSVGNMDLTVVLFFLPPHTFPLTLTVLGFNATTKRFIY